MEAALLPPVMTRHQPGLRGFVQTDSNTLKMAAHDCSAETLHQSEFLLA
jgi:hypothetical protein